MPSLANFDVWKNLDLILPFYGKTFAIFLRLTYKVSKFIIIVHEQMIGGNWRLDRRFYKYIFCSSKNELIFPKGLLKKD